MQKNKLNIKSTGFDKPDNYFEALDKSILDKLNKQQKSALDGITESGHRSPKDYFLGLENKIVNNVSGKKNLKVIPLFNKKNIIYMSSIAAAILLFFTLSINTNSKAITPIENNIVIDIDNVEDFIIMEDIGLYEIAALLDQNQLNENSFTDLNLKEDNLEEFLFENADIEDLITE